MREVAWALMLVVASASCVSTEGLAGGNDTGAAPAVADVTQAPPPPVAQPKPSPCPTTTARFCLDFEDRTLGGWFTTQDDTSPEPATLEDPTAPSPRFALGTRALAGKQSWSSIYRIVSVQGDTLRLEVDMNIAPPKTPSTAGFNPISISDAPGAILFVNYWAMPFGDRLMVSTDGTDANTKTFVMDPPAPRGTWTHASIEVRFATHGHVKMMIDGRVLVDQGDVPTASKDAAPADGVRVYLGAQTTATSSAAALPEATAKYDNVQVF